MVTFFECYDYSDQVYLIEMGFDFLPREMQWEKIRVPQENVHPLNWQVPYLVSYLNADGTDEFCDQCYGSKISSTLFRAAFFIFKTDGTVLQTPYGMFDLKNGKAVPERLLQLVEFEEVD